MSNRSTSTAWTNRNAVRTKEFGLMQCVLIMTVCPKNKYYYGIIVDAVNKTKFLGDASAPTSLWLSLQRLWMVCTSIGMNPQLPFTC